MSTDKNLLFDDAYSRVFHPRKNLIDYEEDYDKLKYQINNYPYIKHTKNEPIQKTALELKHDAEFEQFIKLMEDAEKTYRQHSYSEQPRSSTSAVIDEKKEIKKEEKKQEDTSDNQEGKCHCCYESDEICLIVPCGHTKYCKTCIEKLKQCPECRVDIKGHIRAFV